MEKSRGSEPSPSGLDARLRQALEPQPEAVERVIRGALAGERRAWRLRLVPAIPVLAVLLLAAVLVAVRLDRPEPKPAGRAAISIENVGGVLIVRSQDGPWVVSGEPERGPSPSGSVIVTYGGNR
ncbi:MAG TPA: hypothetical protein VG477_16225 [Thermoanaerobaculia bacterium]|nr:hypothetical protein [Thermoanaerobaculia bacterium]